MAGTMFFSIVDPTIDNCTLIKIVGKIKKGGIVEHIPYKFDADSTYYVHVRTAEMAGCIFWQTISFPVVCGRKIPPEAVWKVRDSKSKAVVWSKPQAEIEALNVAHAARRNLVQAARKVTLDLQKEVWGPVLTTMPVPAAAEPDHVAEVEAKTQELQKAKSDVEESNNGKAPLHEDVRALKRKSAALEKTN